MSSPSLSPRSSLDSLRSSESVISVPNTLAPPMSGPMVWKGNELKASEYVEHLNAVELQSIRDAILYFRLTNLELTAIEKAVFPLIPELSQKLVRMSDALHCGVGVAVLRGLEAANINSEEATIAFAGLCTYVGPLRATDSYANQTLSHIRDATHDTVPSWARNIGLAGSKITSKMDFHSDRFSGDILAMCILDDGGPGNGGEQSVASFWSIYNELLEKDPAVLETMAEANWPFELKQKDGDPYLELSPTLFFSKGKPICQLTKAPLLGGPRIPRSASMPGLTEEQLHALDVVEKLAKEFAAPLDRQKGDLQFFNNLSIMHARSAYGKAGKRSTRHFLRMFLRDPTNAWDRPATCRAKFDDPFTSGREQNMPIVDSDPWRKISGRDSHG